jgi:hypothetical protein
MLPKVSFFRNKILGTLSQYHLRQGHLLTQRLNTVFLKKGALGVVTGAEQHSDLLIEKHCHIKTVHKSLVSLSVKGT